MTSDGDTEILDGMTTRQFNTYLTPELIGRLKHDAVDHAISTSVLVERLLRKQLGMEPEPPRRPHRRAVAQPVPVETPAPTKRRRVRGGFL